MLRAALGRTPAASCAAHGVRCASQWRIQQRRPAASGLSPCRAIHARKPTADLHACSGAKHPATMRNGLRITVA
ncbi:hypothetical protein F511_46496 [Dorcoceras hygrometricum]|uniref:Uncharacterized protein n=1 Tax=Dorcoceras hygrometricum TaxID=472368 RepID=A0A2Z7A0S4_9LAMI|nr:hypothetical protein F511_46496 [Dorcoceras hygrometricum]